MSFFEQLSQLGVAGNLVLVVSMQPGADMSVSVLLNNPDVTDKAQSAVVPLVFTGPAAEIDGIFIETITTPLQSASKLFLNMEAHMQSQEKAKQNSKIEKDLAESARKEKEAKKKVYEASMVKVEELVKENKFREAVGKMPKAEDYPEQADLIKKRTQELTAKFSQPGLFDSFSPVATPEATA